MAVSPHHRLIRLHEALSRCPNQPDNRAVIMVARVKPAFEVADLKLAALDPGARHGTACAGMLVGLLRDMKAKGTAGPPSKEKFGWKDATIPAALRWGELFTTPPQATTGPYLWKLHEEGWQMSAPRLDRNREEAIPQNSPPIILL